MPAGGRRLLFGFAAVAMMVVMVATVGLVSLRSGVSAMDTVAQDQSRDIDRALRLRFAVEQRIANGQALLLGHNPRFRHEEEAEDSELVFQIASTRASFESRHGKQLLDQIQDAMVDYQNALSSLDGRRTGMTAHQLARAYDQELTPRRDVLEGLLRQLLAHKRALLAKAEQQADQRTSHAEMWIVLASLAALGLSLGVAWSSMRWFKELRRREDQLQRGQREALDQVHGMLDALPVLLSELDTELRYRYVSLSYEEWFGEPRTNVVGRPMAEVIGPAAFELLKPHLDRSLAGERVSFEARVPYRNCGTRDIRAIHVPRVGPSGAIERVITLTADVTQETRAHQRELFLAQAGEELLASLDVETTLGRLAELAVPALADRATVHMLQEDGHLVQVAAAETNGAAPALAEAPIAPDPEEPATTAPRHAAVEDLVDTGAAERVERVIRHRRPYLDDTTVSVPIAARGAVLGAITLRAISSGRRYDRSDLAFVQELARRAALAVENARLYRLTRRALEARDELLQVVSHDLRNPLGVILLKSEVLQERVGELGTLRDLNLDVIQRAASRMDALVAALADVTRIEAGRMTLDRDNCDPVSLASEAVEVLEALAADKQVSLVLDAPPPGTVAAVLADSDRVLQVLSNLIGNAIKFTPEGGHIRVRVAAGGDDSEVRFTVEDTGPGIPADDLRKIFDRFWQGRPGRRSSGLGLYIARGIVENHGGRIWAESTVGAGARFHFTLPMALSVRPTARAGDPATRPVPHRS